MNAENRLMLTVAKARSEAYAKSYLVTKDYYDDLIKILLYTMTLGLDEYVEWPNWHVSSHFQGIMDAVRASPMLQALYHEHWIWQHQGKLTEFVTEHLLDFGGKTLVELNFGSKTESEIASEYYNWMLNNYYDVGGLNGIKNAEQSDYNNFMATVPDDLADKPFLDSIISSLEQTASCINAIVQTSKPNKVYWSSDIVCKWTSLGDTIAYRDSVYASTLEAIHNGAKKVSTTATYVAVGAVAGYVLLKVASAFVTLGTGALAVEGTLPVVAEYATAIGTGATAADLAATYLVGRLYAETTATTIGDIEGINTIWSDSIKACKLAVQEAEKDPKGQIVNVSIPSVISSCDVFSVSGNVTISNLDAVPTNVTIFVNVYDLSGFLLSFVETPSKGYETLAAGETKTFPFSLALVRSLTSKLYVAEVYASLGFTVIGPSVTTFVACSPDEYTAIVSSIEQTVQTGTMSQGNVIIQPFDIPDGASQMQFILFYPWGRFDLHLYDEYGNHLGINYETDVIEQQIPNSAYSGIATNPQSIVLSGDPPNKHYSLHIVCFQSIGEECFALIEIRTPKLQAMLDAFPKKIYLTNRIDPSAKYVTTEFTVNEFGGQQPLQNVMVTISDLKNGCKGKISSGSIAIAPSLFDVPAGGFVTVTLNITLESIQIGNYTGTIHVSTGNQAIDIPIQFECVTSQYLISSSLKALKQYINKLPLDVFYDKNPKAVNAMKIVLSCEIDAIILIMSTPCSKCYTCALNMLLSCVKPQVSRWIINIEVRTGLQNWIGWIAASIQNLI
jgi:hypothetical protein